MNWWFIMYMAMYLVSLGMCMERSGKPKQSEKYSFIRDFLVSLPSVLLVILAVYQGGF